MGRMSDAFTRHGSDKATYHSYGPFYDNVVEMFEPKSILEFGVERGGSMKAWMEVLPDAKVVGMDRDVTPEDSIKNLQNPSHQRMIRRDPKRRSMLRHDHPWGPYQRQEGLDVIQCCCPDFSAAIENLRSRGISYDLIIDDASHLEHDQITTFHFLREFLAPNGLYVIEDLQNTEIMNRFARAGFQIEDLRPVQNRWDDIIAWIRI